MKQDDKIIVNVRLHEKDTWPDSNDDYNQVNFEAAIPEIISVKQGDYIEKAMKVTDGSDRVEFYMRYSYIARRTSR